MTEHDVLTRARFLGLLAYRAHYAGDPGYPQLTIAGRRGVLFAWILGTGGRLDARQRRWQHMLLTGGAACHAWRPLDWDTGQVEAELRAIGHPLPG